MLSSQAGQPPEEEGGGCFGRVGASATPCDSGSVVGTTPNVAVVKGLCGRQNCRAHNQRRQFKITVCQPAGCVGGTD